MSFITLPRVDGVSLTFNVDHIKHIESPANGANDVCYIFVDNSIPFCVQQSYLEVVGELKGLTSGQCCRS